MPQDIQIKLIEDEMKSSYIDYAMSVITARALPDARDGLKPVHRRVLFAMNGLGLQSNKPTRKSARIVGETLGKFHPHSDISVYDALMRMAQDFSLRYPLVVGQGNVGCFTGDTKIKLLDGTSKSFKELCNIYKKDEIFYVYSINKNGDIVIGEAKNPRLTKRDSQIIEITLYDGEKIRCTPDHKFLLKNLKYKKAKDLTPNDSLMPGYFRLSPIRGNTELKNYLMIKDNINSKYIFVHEIADIHNLEKNFYKASDGPVRHHIDFNKFNNNPNNLKRLSWKEHTKIHNNHIKELWKNEEFRLKQSLGVKKFYKNNPEQLERLRRMLIERNKDPNFIKKYSKRRKEIWSNEELKQKLSNKLKKFWDEHPEKKKVISELSKKMWSDKNKRENIIKRIKEVLKSEIVRERISEGQYNYIYNHPEATIKRIKSLKEFYNKNPEARKLISERSKKLWLNESYRSKFINERYNHLSEMAKKAWQNEDYKKLQSEKAKKLWKDEHFRNKIIESVRKRDLIRIKEKPDFMKTIAEKAAISHKINWKNKNYKDNIIKNKTLYYVNRLIHKIGEENINESNYNKFRTNNCFPRFDNAVKKFKDINEMITLAKEYNHHIIEIKFLDYTEDVYDITVNEYHNFLLDYGIFVHNSIDGDPPAAQRYTEAKLSKLAEEILEDIDKDTVDFIPNFDNSLKEPVVLPSKLPNLLINGSSGIAVGMATNIPPHNISEIIDAITLLIDNKEAHIEDIFKILKGPDFPTGGLILGYNGIKQAYSTGKGKIIIRAKTHYEKNNIVITEIPYQINKVMLIESIADLVREKIVDGISDIRDESDKHGIRILIELKNESNKEIILNQLYKHTNLQSTFGIILLALVDNEPKILTLKEIIQHYIAHRKEVVTRRTKFDLKKAEERLHIVHGLNIALINIDNVVKLIRGSTNPDIAKSGLMNLLKLTDIQAQAILDMRLQRLTSLERDKLKDEQLSLEKVIQDLKSILASEEKIYSIIKNELLELKNKFSDKRKTEILDIEEEIETEDLIKEEEVVVTVTNLGYIKQLPAATYKQQRRGGLGIRATETKEEDFVTKLFITSNHNYLLFFTNLGRIYWLKTYKIPLASRYSKGKAIVNLLNLSQNEKVTAILPIQNFDDQHHLIMVTKKGLVKKTNLKSFSKPRKTGINAITLKQNDELIQVRLTPGTLKFVLATKNGHAVKFDEKDVRTMGRLASGVRAIRLKNDEVIGLEVARSDATLLTITENGYGKRTIIEDYRLIKRGGKGVINIQTSDRNGKVVGIKTVMDDDEVMVISKKGIAIRVLAKDISVIGRNTQGVRIMKLKEDDKVTSLARVVNNIK